MKYYIELTLIDNSDLSLYKLWSKLYAQIHLAFVELKDEQNEINIGVSFPKYRFDSENNCGLLGEKLRLFSETDMDLVNLNIHKWLVQLTDYIHISVIHAVPENNVKGYVSFSRIQVKSSVNRLARRYAKRHQIDEKTALERYASMTEEKINLPFVRMKSLSTNEAFCLYIKKRPSSLSSEKQYSTYGLSKVSSVPEF